MVVEGTALLARLRCVLKSFAGDRGGTSAQGRAKHAQSRPPTGVSASVLAAASQRNSRLRDLWPIRWQLRLRRHAPLSSGQRTPPTLSLSYTLLSPLRVALLPVWHLVSASSQKPTPRIDSRTHGLSTLLNINHPLLPGHHLSLRTAGPRRARSHQHDTTPTTSIHPLPATKRESRPSVSWNRRPSARRVTLCPVHLVANEPGVLSFLASCPLNHSPPPSSASGSSTDQTLV